MWDFRGAIKALLGRPPIGSRAGFRAAGAGAVYLPPGARLDYAREAGPLHLNQVVAIGLGWIYDQMPSARLRVGTIDGDGMEAVESHPLYDLTKRPNPYFSWQETIGSTAGDFKVDGNAYWIKARDGNGRGVIREIYWVPNCQVTVVGSGDPMRPIDRYDVILGGTTTSYDPQDVVHFRDMPDPVNPLLGLGRIKRQLRAVAGLNAGDTLTAAALRNAHTGIVLVPKTDNIAYDVAGSPEAAALEAEARATKRAFGGEGFGGVRKANLPVEYVRVGYTPQELTLDTILDRPEAFLAASMGLNSLVLNLPSSRDTRTYSNYAEARKAAWEDGIVPMQDAFAGAIQTQLLFVGDPATGVPYAEFGDPEGTECWWDRSRVAALQEDAENKATRAVMIYNAGGVVDAEWVRSELGIELPPERVAAIEEQSQMGRDAANGISPDGGGEDGGGNADGTDNAGDSINA